MKLVPFITVILITSIKSQTEYVSSVPQMLADVFAAAGTACNTDADCDALYSIPSTITASWSCVASTGVIQSDGTTKDISFCKFTECDPTGSDCDINAQQICYKINQCDDDNEFYEESYNLYSTICEGISLCNNIKTVGQWTDTSMCYEGKDDGTTFYSEEEVSLCGGSSGTCVISSSVCKPATTTTAAATSDCIADKTCCNKDDYDQKGCVELLFTEYLIYTIIVLALIFLCICGCCCYCVKSRKKASKSRETMREV